MKREEFEEIDEFDDVEEFDDIEDEVDEFEDEEPAPKKAKKAPKAKKAKKGGSKGKKAVIGLSVTVAIIAIIAVVFVFVVMPMLKGAETSADYTGTIGKTKPTGSAANAVTSSMNAFEMMNTALKNYDEAEYAANICVNGGVLTKVGPIDVNQGVNSLKVRLGKATDSDVQYFNYSKSMGIANMNEEYYMKADGSIVYRKAAKAAKGKTADGGQRVVVNSWESKKDFADLAAFQEATSTNFTKIWSYEVNDTTVTAETKNSKPAYDSKEGFYTFTIAIDINNEASIAGYKEVMKYQLSSNMGMTVNELTFTKLEFEFSVWDNGYIRYLAIHEAYVMDLADVPVIGKLNGMGIENNYMNEYSFDPNEKIPYDTCTKTEEIKELSFAELVALF